MINKKENCLMPAITFMALGCAYLFSKDSLTCSLSILPFMMAMLTNQDSDPNQEPKTQEGGVGLEIEPESVFTPGKFSLIFSEIAVQANASIVVTDHKGRIEWVNPGFFKQTGYHMDEVVGKKPGDFLQGPLTNPRDVENFRLGIKSKKPFNVEILNYSKSGETYIIEAIVSPIIGPDGNLERCVSIQKDITESKRKSEELARLYEATSASIRYAKQIQDSVLDNFNKFDKHLIDSFVFFQPKDSLSGDFFGIRKVGDVLFVVCGDCTGHGVPAAFLSLITLNALDTTLLIDTSQSPASILKKTYEKVNSVLNPDYRNQITDSFELAIVKIEGYLEIRKKITISSNRIRLMRVVDNSAIEIETERSGNLLTDRKDFTIKETTFDTDGNSTLYMWTDGYTDQTGGVLKRKYSRKNFQQFLTGLSTLPIALQEESLKTEFETWKGSEIQLDDVTVIGIKL